MTWTVVASHAAPVVPAMKSGEVGETEGKKMIAAAAAVLVAKAQSITSSVAARAMPKWVAGAVTRGARGAGGQGR